MWLNEYFLKSCSNFLSQLWNKSINESDNNLQITSVRSSLDLSNKIWIGKPFIDIAFHFKNPRLGFSFLPPVGFENI